MRRCPSFTVAIVSLLCALIGGPGLAGCASDGPAAPEAWQPLRVSDASTIPDFDDTSPAVQVLICQGSVCGTHTGLRLLRPTHEIIFWDPAGQFAWGRDDIHRSRDVISENTPGLDEYIDWRFNGANDSAVALYEWMLSPQRADELADVLMHGAPAAEGESEFKTSTVGLFCCNAVCKFLDRFMADRIDIPTHWFRPERLAEHLWSQHPDRVAIFRSDGTTEVFIAPQH